MGALWNKGTHGVLPAEGCLWALWLNTPCQRGTGSGAPAPGRVPWHLQLPPPAPPISPLPEVLMLRRCLTWLRATPIAELVPLDQHVVFHQLVGYVVLALAAVHTGAHVANFSK